jgi:hypothetical protein
MNHITIERLYQVLEYFPDTGIFIWKIDRKRLAKAGSLAGSTNGSGYRQISIDGKLYLAHRLAWFYCFKEWPNLVDHINRNKLDNRLDNLREVTQSLNIHNSSDRPSKSGFRNARKVGDKFQSEIKVNGRSIHLGMYDTAEQASAAAKKYREGLQ